MSNKYKEVLWFRKSDFFMFLSIFLPVSALLVMLSGNVYVKNGAWPRQMEDARRFGLAVLYALALFFLFRLQSWAGLMGPVANVMAMMEGFKDASELRAIMFNDRALAAEASVIAVGVLAFVPAIALVRMALGVFLFLVGLVLAVYSILSLSGLL